MADDPSPTAVASRPPSRLRRFLTGAALIFLALYTGVFFELNDRALGRLISWAVTRSVRGTFTIGRAHYDYWGGLWSILTNRPTHVTGGDFEMLDPDGRVVMRVPHVDAEVHLQELVLSLARYAATRHFNLMLHFRSAQVPAGYAMVVPTRSSWGTAKPELNIVAAMSGKKPGTDDLSDFQIAVDELELGPIEFALGSSNALGQLSWLGRLDGARGRGKLAYSSQKRKATADGPAFFFTLRDVEVPDGDLALGDFDFPLRGLKVAWFGTVSTTETGKLAPAPGAPPGFGPRQTLAFNAGATTHDGQVGVRGELVDAYGAHPGVRMRIDVEHARGLASLLPDPVASWIGGEPRGAITLEGPFSDLAIGGEIAGATVDLAGLHLTEAGGRLQVGGGGLLKLDRLHGAMGRGALRGKVELQLTGRRGWRAEIDASGVDPGGLATVPPALRASVAGRFSGRLRLAGALGPRAAPAIDVDLTDGVLDRSTVDRLPKHLALAGRLRWLGDRLELDEATLQGDGASLGASGRVSLGREAAAALDFHLGVTSGAWIERLGLPGDLRIERARAWGHVQGPLLGLEGTARVELRGLEVRGRRFDHAHADVSLAGGRLKIDALTGEGVGAALAGYGSLALFGADGRGRTRLDRRVVPPILDAALRAEGADLAQVFATDSIAGNGDLEIALKGPLSGPSGHARITVPDVALLGDHYRDGRLAFDFSEEGAKVTALHLARAGGGRLDGTGRVGWEGALDLTLDPHDFPLAAIPGVSTLPLSGTLSGKVHLGGDLTHLQPGGVISLVGAKIRDTLFGDGSLKIEPGADAVHITGKFFQNFTVDGYLTIAPKLSVVVTIQFDDVEIERLFPELRRFAEVRGKASGEARVTADASQGLTFAGLRLGQLSLVLSGIDETGQARRLIVRNQEDVTLSTNGHELVVDRCFLRSALGAFSIHGRISQKDSDVELRGQIGLELLEYFFTSFFQHMHGDAGVNLTVRGDLTTRPQLLGSVDLRRATFQPRSLEGHHVFVPSGVVRFEPDGVRLESLKVEQDGAVAQASGRIALRGFVPGAIEGDVSGELSARLLQWFLPDQIGDAGGRVSAKVHLGGTWQRPEWRGDAEIRKARFTLRRSGREVAVDEGTLRLNNYDIAIGCDARAQAGCRAVSGSVDDESRFAISGTIGFGDGLALRRVQLHAEANDLAYTGEDFSVRVSPTLDIAGAGGRLELGGTVNVVEGRYTRNFDLVDLLLKPQRSVERPEPFWQGIALLELMKLDVRAKSTGPLSVRNNIADLSFSTDLVIGGTLGEPTLGGEVNVEQGGTINIPLCRFPFLTNRGQLTFDPEKRYPETPNVQISATGVLVSDRTDASQNINVQVLGPLNAAQLQLSTQQGVQNSDVLLMCVSGKTAEELRRGTSPATVGGGAAPAIGAVQGTTTTEGVAKSASGALVASALDPLRKVVRLDTLALEFGATGVDVRACKRWTRGLKTCGQGEIGFIGGTRVGGYLEYRLLDQFSVLGRGEYLTRGLETQQESLTRGRLELNLRLPLAW